jgi:Ribonuclease G/E
MRRLFVAAEREPMLAVSIAADGRLDGFWRLGGRGSLVGERFIGRVRTVDRSLDAAFVEIGLERPGFLPFDRCPRIPVEGEALAVEVTREAVDGKGARLTACLSEPVVLPRDARPPQRLAAEPALIRLVRKLGTLEITVDTRRLAEELSNFAPRPDSWRVVYRARREWPISPSEMEAEAAGALEPRVELAGGGWILFEHCRTLTVVDVNSGSTGSSGAERTWFKTNLAAAHEVARQLRLRHIGGIVVIDFINLKTRAWRFQVAGALRKAAAEDWEPCWVGEMSRLGLVEMTRRRAGPSLAEMLEQEAP